jgi:hypothetical protein
MCFSATASFTVGAALVPAAAYCTRQALRKDGRFLPLAVVPFFFAVQQFTEGLVWIGLEHEDPALIQAASVAYLFFAMAFWPFWIPLSFLCSESRRGLAWALGVVMVLGLAWTWLYLPILLSPGTYLTTEVFQHSIRYVIGDIAGYSLASRWAWRTGYLVIIVVPIAIGCTRGQTNGRDTAVSVAGGAALVASFVVAYYLYMQVFVSVWCFFAAVLALMLCYVFYRLPADHRHGTVQRGLNSKVSIPSTL